MGMMLSYLRGRVIRRAVVFCTHWSLQFWWSNYGHYTVGNCSCRRCVNKGLGCSRRKNFFIREMFKKGWFADGVDLSTVWISKSSQIATYLSFWPFKAKSMIIISDIEVEESKDLQSQVKENLWFSFRCLFYQLVSCGSWVHALHFSRFE